MNDILSEAATGYRLLASSQSPHRTARTHPIKAPSTQICRVDFERESLARLPVQTRGKGSPRTCPKLTRKLAPTLKILELDVHYLRQTPARRSPSANAAKCFSPHMRLSKIFTLLVCDAFPRAAPEQGKYTQIFVAVKGSRRKSWRFFVETFSPVTGGLYPALPGLGNPGEFYAWRRPFWRTSTGLFFPVETGAERARTANLLVANQALSQLSYGPKKAVSDRPSTINGAKPAYPVALGSYPHQPAG